MQDIYEKTIEDLGGLMIKFFGCDRITMPIQQAIVLLEAHQKIIRCKDCKFNDRCELRDLLLNHEDGYCSDAEKKDT